MGTTGSRFMGTILETRSSRSLQRPAEEVLGAVVLLGINDVLGVDGVVGGGGNEGATAEAGSSVALLGGRTRPLVALGIELGCERPAGTTPF
jgi:hypothetical protein